MKHHSIPADGLAGLKQFWKSDLISGFLVFLLALPLSLGIARASEFPIAMGVLTAMIGGLVVSIFAGSRLTIKGPAAGLITVCAGAVMEMGGGEAGWHLACGVIVVTAALQFVLGLLKVGKFSDFFPLSAVHGMLAAIGILIFAKQFPVLLGVDAALTKGLSPVELYAHIPQFLQNENNEISIIGITSLIILFGLPRIKNPILKKIPAPMVVLVIAIPLAKLLGVSETHPDAMVTIGDFWKNVNFNASFDAIGQFVFWKYVIMFLFINSLESLLTVKAIDGLDPFRRTSDYDKDLRALSLGNGISGLLGGLPMISEVARSSANVAYGAVTRWSNFFHGLFLLIAMLVLIPVIELIPSSALAAMLISVAYRLASPKEFIGAYKIGPEQLVIFVVTILVTVGEDLLMGVAAGILVKFIFHLLNGATLGSLFKAKYQVETRGDETIIYLQGVATFSNFIGYKTILSKIKTPNITLDFAQTKLVDHSFLDQLHHLEEEFHKTGHHLGMVGLEKFSPFSNHPLAARKVAKEKPDRLEIRLSNRQIMLKEFAEKEGAVFFPQRVFNQRKFKEFPITTGNKIHAEENIITFYLEDAKVDVSEVTLVSGARSERLEKKVTVFYVSDLDFSFPDFAMEPEKLWHTFLEFSYGKDINFDEAPVFSAQYYLRGEKEGDIRDFFNMNLLKFFAEHEPKHVESHRNKLLIYGSHELASIEEFTATLRYIQDLVASLKK